MNRLVMLFLAFFLLTAMSADLPVYSIYKTNGEKINFEQLSLEVQSADVVFFGELHNNPIAHWMQLELSKKLLDAKQKRVIFGAEMFETDQQLILNEYISGVIRAKDFESGTRLWPNYTTDYKPLVDLAKENNVKFVATNIPRRYAALVSKGGFAALEKLENQAKTLIAPLPIKYDSTLPGYAAMLQMGDMGHANANLPKAQAAKDATMAWSIAQSVMKDHVLIHFNGSYHSDNYEGIIWYLKQYRPDLKIVTVTTISVPNPNEVPLNDLKSADFTLVVDEDMTSTGQ